MAKTHTDRRVVVTRPEAQAQSFCSALDAEGFRPAQCPVLEIIGLESADAVQTTACQIQALDEFSVLIFVSQNAVTRAFDWIEDYWPEFPVGLKSFAVGSKTSELLAERLRRLGHDYAQDFEARASMDSEALLALPELSEEEIADRKVLIFRGAGGRHRLSEGLTERGAYVQYCELYQRCLPEAALAGIQTLSINPKHDIVTLFSGESLENFDFLLDKAGVPDGRSVHLVVPGERVARQARGRGYSHISVADNAGEEAMLAAVARANKATT